MSWIKLKEEQPEDHRHCWCIDSDRKLYMASYYPGGIFSFFGKRKFHDLQGRGWPIDNVVYWQYLEYPEWPKE